jgi:ectoine hydroxylase
MYTSRNAKNADIVKRSDPIVWSTTYNKGFLTEEQLKFYEDNGYLILPEYFKDIQTLSNDVDSLRDSIENKLTNETLVTHHTNYVTESGTKNIRSIFDPHLSDINSIRSICRDPTLVGIAKQILNDDVYIHQSRINYQRGCSSQGSFYWHSDFETWYSEGGMQNMRALSTVVYLDDNHAYNSALMVMPGSHKEFVRCPGLQDRNNWEESLQKNYNYGSPSNENLRKLAETYGIIHCEAPKGSVLVFDCNLMHGSHTNISPFGRRNIFQCFNSYSNQLKDPFESDTIRPEHIDHRIIVEKL